MTSRTGIQSNSESLEGSLTLTSPPAPVPRLRVVPQPAEERDDAPPLRPGGGRGHPAATAAPPAAAGASGPGALQWCGRLLRRPAGRRRDSHPTQPHRAHIGG